MEALAEIVDALLRMEGRGQALIPADEPHLDFPAVRHAQQVLSDLLRKVNSGEHRPQAVWTFRRLVEDHRQPDVYPTLTFSSKKY